MYLIAEFSKTETSYFYASISEINLHLFFTFKLLELQTWFLTIMQPNRYMDCVIFLSVLRQRDIISRRLTSAETWACNKQYWRKTDATSYPFLHC